MHRSGPWRFSLRRYSLAGLILAFATLAGLVAPPQAGAPPPPVYIPRVPPLPLPLPNLPDLNPLLRFQPALPRIDLRSTLPSVDSPTPVVRPEDEARFREERRARAREVGTDAERHLRANEFREAIPLLEQFLSLTANEGEDWEDARVLASQWLTQAYTNLVAEEFEAGRWDDAVATAQRLRQYNQPAGCLLLANLYANAGLTPLQVAALRCAEPTAQVQKALQVLADQGLSEFIGSSGPVEGIEKLPEDEIVRPQEPQRGPAWDVWSSAFIARGRSVFILYATAQPPLVWLSEVVGGAPRIVRVFGSQTPDSTTLMAHLHAASAVSARYEQAETELHRDPATGEALLHQILRDDPDHVAARTTLAQRMVERHEEAEMRALLEPLVQSHPSWGLTIRGNLLHQLAGRNSTSDEQWRMANEAAREDMQRAAVVGDDPIGILPLSTWWRLFKHWWFTWMAWLNQKAGMEDAAREVADRAATIGGNPSPLLALLKIEWGTVENSLQGEEARIPAIQRTADLIRRIRLVAPDHLGATEYEGRLYLVLELFGPAGSTLRPIVERSQFAAGALKYLYALDHATFNDPGEGRLADGSIVRLYWNAGAYPDDSTLVFHDAEIVVTDRAGFPQAFVLSRQRLYPDAAPEFFLDLYHPAGHTTLARFGTDQPDLKATAVAVLNGLGLP